MCRRTPVFCGLKRMRRIVDGLLAQNLSVTHWQLMIDWGRTSMVPAG